MSRHRRHRSRSRQHKPLEQRLNDSDLRSGADESAEVCVASPEIAMLLADECPDDRPPVAADIGARTNSNDEAVTNSTLGRALQAQAADPPGVALRQRREARGLTLDDLSRTTKINKAALRALEAGDVLHLPAAIYTRGFVKAYAREVGLDPDTTADAYLKCIEPQRVHHPPSDDPLPLPAAVTHHMGTPRDAQTLLALAENQIRRVSPWTMVVAVIGLVVYLMSFGGGNDAPADVLTAVDATALSDAARTGGLAPDGTSGADATAAAVTDGPLRLELVTQGPCWVSAHVDGEHVLARLLQPGERQTLDISAEAILRVGEPGALSISINGRTGRPLGRAGQPVNVRITKDNFREFLIS